MDIGKIIHWINLDLNKTMKTKEKIKWAKLFHDTYERLAPSFGYETREDTKEFDPNSKNGKLMLEVCSIVLSQQKQEIVKELNKTADKEWGKVKALDPDCEAYIYQYKKAQFISEFIYDFKQKLTK